MLVENARTQSQQHLLAISKRKSIPDDVTDVLVARGNIEVATSVAANDGARLSGSGFLNLVKRSENDSILAEHVGLRKDIPRHLFQQLISKASDEVKRKLAREHHEKRVRQVECRNLKESPESLSVPQGRGCPQFWPSSLASTALQLDSMKRNACFFHLAREAADATGTGHSPRPADRGHH